MARRRDEAQRKGEKTHEDAGVEDGRKRLDLSYLDRNDEGRRSSVRRSLGSGDNCDV